MLISKVWRAVQFCKNTNILEVWKRRQTDDKLCHFVPIAIWRLLQYLKCFANSFPSPRRPVQIVLFVFIYVVNEHKKGQFEPTGLGKLIEKQFRS
jgi:hypothetical protein